MAGTVADERSVCTVSGCKASAVGGDAGRCLAHLNHDELAGALAAARSDGFLDAQGVRFDARRLGQVLAVFEDDGEVRVPAVDLTGATFVDRATFAAVVFGGPASVFMDGADFASATFTDGAYFAGSKFERTFAEDGSARRTETDPDAEAARTDAA